MSRATKSGYSELFESNYHQFIIKYLGSFTNNLDIKSFASFEILSNSSALKSHFADVTLTRVSASVSPTKGDNPDNLQNIKISYIITNKHINMTYHYLLLYTMFIEPIFIQNVRDHCFRRLNLGIFKVSLENTIYSMSRRKSSFEVPIKNWIEFHACNVFL